MIRIRKKPEPPELLTYRLSEHASYEDMDPGVKERVLESLLREQGFICAYCMRRIPERKPRAGTTGAVIEHWAPRHPDDGNGTDRSLDYGNMLAVCTGNRGCGDFGSLTCDAKKGNQILHVHPCREETLIGIGYTSDGRIRSADPVIDEDLNVRLNLNCESLSLPENRRSALAALQKKIRKDHPSGDIRLYCQRTAEKLRSSNEKLPYVGILLWWLDRHS